MILSMRISDNFEKKTNRKGLYSRFIVFLDAAKLLVVIFNFLFGFLIWNENAFFFVVLLSLLSVIFLHFFVAIVDLLSRIEYNTRKF